jgi:hypothetical protein
LLLSEATRDPSSLILKIAQGDEKGTRIKLQHECLGGFSNPQQSTDTQYLKFERHAKDGTRCIMKERYLSNTYSCKSIHPFRYSVPSQFVTRILTEMVAVLNNQMIRITIVISRLALHELSNLFRI